MDQNGKLWVHLVCVLTVNFETLFTHCPDIMTDYLWSKFQQIQAIFRAERAKKPTKRGHFMDPASLPKHLKIYDLGTTNAMPMKRTMILYHHKIFNLAKNWGVTHRA